MSRRMLHSRAEESWHDGRGTKQWGYCQGGGKGWQGKYLFTERTRRGKGPCPRGPGRWGTWRREACRALRQSVKNAHALQRRGAAGVLARGTGSGWRLLTGPCTAMPSRAEPMAGGATRRSGRCGTIEDRGNGAGGHAIRPIRGYTVIVTLQHTKRGARGGRWGSGDRRNMFPRTGGEVL